MKQYSKNWEYLKLYWFSYDMKSSWVIIISACWHHANQGPPKCYSWTLRILWVELSFKEIFWKSPHVVKRILCSVPKWTNLVHWENRTRVHGPWCIFPLERVLFFLLLIVKMEVLQIRGKHLGRIVGVGGREGSRLFLRFSLLVVVY